MTPLSTQERAELKKLTRRIRTQRATYRELQRAIDLTNRDHDQVKERQAQERQK